MVTLCQGSDPVVRYKRTYIPFHSVEKTQRLVGKGQNSARVTGPEYSRRLLVSLRVPDSDSAIRLPAYPAARVQRQWRPVGASRDDAWISWRERTVEVIFFLAAMVVDGAHIMI